MAASGSTETDTVLADFQLTRSLAIQWTLVGTLGFVVAIGGLSAFYQFTTGQVPSYNLAPAGVEWWVGPINVLVLVVLVSAILIPHEWLHGLAIQYYGGEPRYGVGLAHFILPYAYATTDYRFTRDQFIIVLLTPLVVLTLVGVPLMIVFEWGWLILPLAANAGGAIGDLWMTLALLGYPSYVTAEDHKSGFRILGREEDRPRDLSMTAVVWDSIVGAAVASVGVLFLLSMWIVRPRRGRRRFVHYRPQGHGHVRFRVRQHARGDIDQRWSRNPSGRGARGPGLLVRPKLSTASKFQQLNGQWTAESVP